MKRTISALVGGILLVAVFAVPACAEAANSYGMVDMSRVTKEYKGFQSVQEEYQQYATDQQMKFNDHQKVAMLTDADYTKYFDLLASGGPHGGEQEANCGP